MASDTVLSRPVRTRPRVGQRTLVLGTLLVAGIFAMIYLRLWPSGLLPGPGGLELTAKFFDAALHPTFTSESDATRSLWPNFLSGLRMTLIFGTAGMSLALVLGLLFGFLGSTAWWPEAGRGGPSSRHHVLRYAIYVPTRALIAMMRSVHELIWALLFLAAFGISHIAAVIAIAIPFGGTLAKVFSEMIDEAPRDVSEVYTHAGATGAQTFAFALLPRALPDIAAYTFYRFECALRSSAVLGFFGFPTLGYYLAASFENLYYREVWFYLYGLVALVTLVELWSSRLREHWVAR